MPAEKPCPEPPSQRHGHTADCPQPYTFNSACQFECDPGYDLPRGGTAEVTCVVKEVNGADTLAWDLTPTDCEGTLRLSKLHLSYVFYLYFIFCFLFSSALLFNVVCLIVID